MKRAFFADLPIDDMVAAPAAFSHCALQQQQDHASADEQILTPPVFKKRAVSRCNYSRALPLLQIALLRIVLVGVFGLTVSMGVTGCAVVSSGGTNAKNRSETAQQPKPNHQLSLEQKNRDEKISSGLSSGKLSAPTNPGAEQGFNDPQLLIDAEESLAGDPSSESAGSIKWPEKLQLFQGHTGAVLAFEEIDGHLLSVGADGVVADWRPDGRVLGTVGNGVLTAAIDSKNGLLATAGRGWIEIRRLPSLRLVARSQLVRTRLAELAFAPNGKSVLMAGLDGSLYRWRFGDDTDQTSDVERARLLERYIAHASSLSAVAYHPLGRLLISADQDGGLNVWLRYDADAFAGDYDSSVLPGRFFVSDENRMRAARAAGLSIDHIAISPDGKFMAVAASTGVVEVWKLRGMQKVAEHQLHKGAIYDLKTDGNGFLSVGRDGIANRFHLNETSPSPESASTYEIVIDKTQSSMDVRLILRRHSGAVVGINSAGKLVSVFLTK